MFVLSHENPSPSTFRVLGVEFDCKLSMRNAIAEISQAMRWKLIMITRSRKYHSDSDLVTLYKAHVLSYIEYRTAAIYHATQGEISIIDRMQAGFLRELGISENDVLLHFNLAPLHTRRDIAMLGVIHRAATGRGPPQLRALFKPAQHRISSRRHRYFLQHVLEGNFLEIARRSAFGLVSIYNSLPGQFVDDGCNVSTFQSRIQKHLKELVENGVHDWARTYCVR